MRSVVKIDRYTIWARKEFDSRMGQREIGYAVSIFMRRGMNTLMGTMTNGEYVDVREIHPDYTTTRTVRL